MLWSTSIETASRAKKLELPFESVIYHHDKKKIILKYKVVKLYMVQLAKIVQLFKMVLLDKVVQLFNIKL